MHCNLTVCLQIVVLMALLIRMLTWQSAMTGLGVTLSVIPLSIWVGRLQTRIRLQVVERTDARVKLTGEVLSGLCSVSYGLMPLHCMLQGTWARAWSCCWVAITAACCDSQLQRALVKQV